MKVASLISFASLLFTSSFTDSRISPCLFSLLNIRFLHLRFSDQKDDHKHHLPISPLLEQLIHFENLFVVSSLNRHHIDLSLFSS